MLSRSSGARRCFRGPLRSRGRDRRGGRSPLRTFIPVLSWALVLLLFTVPASARQGPDPGSSQAAQAGPVMPWPAPIPIRLAPEEGDDLFVMLLGPVETPLADGTFYPASDRVVLDSGEQIEDYYRDRLGIAWYEPIDKSVFPVPPSGWCSWYYYYQEIDAEEVLANARWMADELRPFGARYVQIDDGWQGTGHGSGDNRDWSTVDVRFRDPGMDGIAGAIRELGMEAGLWLAPHGQSNEELVRRWGTFLTDEEGDSASSTWEGTWLLDPTHPRASAYLTDLFTRLRGWGYSYFKIDGQPIVISEFASKQRFMHQEPEGEPGAAAARLYRQTLRTIRDAIGEDSYLLGCWGIPLAGAGIFDGSRTAGDVVQGWDGFLVAADAAQRWNFLHNIVWYSDPDVLLVRPPMRMGTARAWATLQGLTGQALMASDRMTDLPESRVELLRRVYPAVDIRPLDLFRPRHLRKPVWDLKVERLGRSYDVVGLFNFHTDRPEVRHLRWEELGLDPARPHHVFDFWEGSWLGAWEEGVFVKVPAGDVRVLTLMPAPQDRPVLLSTSRHITQGWTDLQEIGTQTGPEHPVMSGRSRLVAGDPYTLTFGLPTRGPTWQIASVDVRGESKDEPVWARWDSHQGYAAVRIESDTSQEVSWNVRFEPYEPYTYPVVAPSRLDARPEGLSRIRLSWPVQYHVKAGYRVEVDGVPVGTALQQDAVLDGLVPGRAYRVGVRSQWYDGSVGEGLAEREVTIPVPQQVYLSDMEPVSSRQDWGGLRRDASVDGNTLSVGGRTAEKGLGMHAAGEAVFRLFGVFRRFEALVGVDDEVSPDRPVEASFQVWGDGRLLWESPTVRSGQEAIPVEVDVEGVERLTLKVLPGDDGMDYDHTDWLEARVIR